jgi:archaellum biogenesis protein FlaJ (TadC family)
MIIIITIILIIITIINVTINQLALGRGDGGPLHHPV